MASSSRRALCVGGFWLALASGAGCAATQAPAAEAPATSVPTAQRLYAVGEQHFAAGRAAEAVDLWRHAILQLPETSKYDGLRHKLVLRRAYGQLVAHAQTGDRAFLDDGQTMLLRYLERHEAIFGADKRAQTERGEVYEILYEFETRLEQPDAATPPAGSKVAAASTKWAAPLDERDEAIGDVRANVMQQYRRSPGVAGSSQPYSAARDSHRLSRPVRDHEVRVVHVDTRGRPSVDDPETRAALRSWATDPQPWLTQPTLVEFLPPRPYVRVGGLAQRVDGDRTRLGGQSIAHQVVRGVRPQLRACYDEAFARRPDEVASATVEFDVQPDGRVVRPRIVGGGVVDPIGDACVLDQLAAARIDPNPDRAAQRVRVPLTFFYDGAVYKDEAGAGDVTTQMQMAMPDRHDTPSRQGQSRTDAATPGK